MELKLNLDEAGLKVKVRVDCLDDLWYLKQTISCGSHVSSWGYRKPDQREELIRPETSGRKRMYLTITVTSTEFHPFTDNLRIKGEIVEGPTDVKGHHTFTVEPGSTIELLSDEISVDDMGLLKEAEERSAEPRFIGVSLDDEEATLFRSRDYGLEAVGTIRAESGGKKGGGGSWDGYYDEIVEALIPSAGEGTPIVIVGPGFFKEVLAKRIRSTIGEGAEVHVISASTGGITGVREALEGTDDLHDVIERSRLVMESRMLARFMGCIGRGEGATYGERQVEKALEMGAVETLLITESVFRTDKGKTLLGAAQATGADRMLISSSHDPGRMFEKMGGIGAILRFEIDG